MCIYKSIIICVEETEQSLIAIFPTWPKRILRNTSHGTVKMYQASTKLHCSVSEKNSCTVYQTINRLAPDVHALNKLFKTPVQVQRSMRLKRRVHVSSRILKNAFKQLKSCQ